MKLGITTPDDFKGLLQGQLTVYSSLRQDDPNRFQEEILKSDIENKLASQIEDSEFAWKVYGRKKARNVARD